jgi:tetratricopeptide (TPR) repeat protein
MKRLRICYSTLGWLVFAALAAVLGQGQESTLRLSQPPWSTSSDHLQGSHFVSGRIVLEGGGSAYQRIPVELKCGIGLLQVIDTELGGYFTFDLRTGLQNHLHFTARSDSSATFGISMGNAPQGYDGPLVGCELLVSAPGYRPLTYRFVQHGIVVEVGTLQLRRVAGAEGFIVNATSLRVPKDARKEFEKALQEIHRNRPNLAKQHLEKAVSLYDKYAASWNELGRLHLSSGDMAKAAEAFEKAIAIDPESVSPYLNLATLQLQNEEWQSALDTAGRILQLDPSMGFASFIQALGNFNLNHLDTAERSAREAEKKPHSNTPQLHALLAEILLRRQAYSDAAAQMRTYLEESPNGMFAERIRRLLEEIEKIGTLTGSEPDPPGNHTP